MDRDQNWLTAPSHYQDYLNHWSSHSVALWHSSENNFTASAQATIQLDEFEYNSFKITAISPMGQWVNLAQTLVYRFNPGMS